MVAAVGQAFEHLLLTHTRVDPEDGVAAATGQDDGAVARGALQDGEWLLAIIISTSEGGGGGRIKRKRKRKRKMKKSLEERIAKETKAL